MSRRYAADTSVPVERTQAEITALLGRHGATARGVGSDDTTGKASVMFVLAGRRIHVEVLLQGSNAPESNPRGWWRWNDEQRRRWTASQREQRERSTWRGLLLLLRAKLEAVEGGYSSIEREFLADVLLPSGQSVGQLVSSAVSKAYMTGATPPLLTQES